MDDDEIETTGIENETEELFQDINNEKRWRYSYLKTQFQTLNLHQLFGRYSERISHGYFSQFLSLQIIVVTTHFLTLLSLSHAADVLTDLILYGVLSLLSIILLVVTDKYVKQHPKLLKYLTTTAFLLTFFTNFFIPCYYYDKQVNLQPAYTTYLIICNYILLNVHNNNIYFAVLLGVMVTGAHVIVLVFLTYKDENQVFERIGAEIIYLVCINGLGFYFHYMNEIVIRRSFLDRRSCVVTTKQLKYEEAQETQLLLSIIPSYIFDRVKKTHLTEATRRKNKLSEELFVSSHENVTILFADIVNYTAMTTKLDIVDLLKTLNELFGRFDDASDELKVLRIKFLGDCYYCVSGLPPDPCPDHADACVALGLKMIEIIEDVRQRRHLDINMRIGIHTGQINSGIIGYIKWQYDIWSSDVDLANKMETEGEAGKVHITEATKQLLKKPYNIKETDRGTYLISPFPTPPNSKTENGQPQNGTISNGRRPTIYTKRPTLFSIAENDTVNTTPNSTTINNTTNINNNTGGGTVAQRRYSGNPNLANYQRPSLHTRPSIDRRLTHGDGKRRTAFMNTNIKRYKEGLEQTDKDLKVKIEEMRLTKFEQWFHLDDMNRLFLTFKTWHEEKSFMTSPDPLFKYYLLSTLLLLFCVYFIENFTLSRWSAPEWPFYMVLGIIVLIMLPMCWTHFLWNKYIGSEEPNNRIVLFYYNMSLLITRKFYARFIVYFVVYLSFCLCVLSEWVDCEQINIFEDLHFQETFLGLITKRSEETSYLNCIVPWHMTETCALAIIMSFMFLRMHMFIKLFFASTIAIVYSVCVWYFSGNYYEGSHTFNYMLKPPVSHILSVVFLTITLHLVDRQTEYMNRLDFLWYRTLIDQQHKSTKIRKDNNKLLQNILPLHVAEIYLNLDRNISDERLYKEHYDDVAVIFASITNYSLKDLGNAFLKVMNQIICEFDMLTIGRPIEKIKIAKWTYMAASGLSPGYGNSRNYELDRQTHPVIEIVKFAADLMAKLKEFNRGRLQNMKLRIGISHGKLAAGVVGSRKPLYDIWGDPVNMASRMDTTGIANKIQVLEETADVIKSFGYKCEYRGLVKVKGRSEDVKTYFVCMDDNFNLIETQTNL